MGPRSGAETAADRVVRLALLLRVVAVALPLLPLAGAPDRSGLLVAALVAAGALSSTALRSWDRLGPVLRRRPLVLAADVAVATALLVAAGPTSPGFPYALATALLGGARHGPLVGTGTAAALGAGYAGACRVWRDRLDPSFLLVAGLPSLLPLAALGAAGLAGVLREQDARAGRRAELARREAVAHERRRLARDLHDTVTGTAEGVALQAGALAAQLRRLRHPLAPAAAALAAGARQTAQESRQVLVDLRADPRRGDHGDELAAAVDEAVRNAVAHAPGATVVVRTEPVPTGGTEVVVQDDGPGFDPERRLAQARADGRYGVVGMAERVERLGGSLRIASAPGHGTTVVIRLPPPPEARAS